MKNIIDDSTGNTLLHIAVLEENLKEVELLIEENCDLFTRNKNGKTALNLADESNNKKIIKAIRHALFAYALDQADNVSSEHITMKKEKNRAIDKSKVESLKIGMGQILVEGGNYKSNLKKAVYMIHKAASEKCKFLVLPECLDLGWTFPKAGELAEPIPGKYSNVLADAAVESKIYVVAGLTEKFENKIYNSAVLISPEGKIIKVHRKINVLDIAQDIYSIGDSLSVVETEYGKVGVDICADNFEDSHALGESLIRMGADIILSPTAWALPPCFRGDDNPCWTWETSFKKLAKTFNVPIVGVSNVGLIKDGVWKQFSCIGNSLAVTLNGEIAAKGGLGADKEELITAEVEIYKNKPKGTEISAYINTGDN
ncbi:MAG TPA: nitrilase-related carbon-nitrogen hydrolase [Victivallales bacterium]|nr:nitrilase-related carbon-nitrogen hydrolase [Victivallales bacterium]